MTFGNMRASLQTVSTVREGDSPLLAQQGLDTQTPDQQLYESVEDYYRFLKEGKVWAAKTLFDQSPQLKISSEARGLLIAALLRIGEKNQAKVYVSSDVSGNPNILRHWIDALIEGGDLAYADRFFNTISSIRGDERAFFSLLKAYFQTKNLDAVKILIGKQQNLTFLSLTQIIGHYFAAQQLEEAKGYCDLLAQRAGSGLSILIGELFDRPAVDFLLTNLMTHCELEAIDITLIGGYPRGYTLLQGEQLAEVQRAVGVEGEWRLIIGPDPKLLMLRKAATRSPLQSSPASLGCQL